MISLLWDLNLCARLYPNCQLKPDPRLFHILDPDPDPTQKRRVGSAKLPCMVAEPNLDTANLFGCEIFSLHLDLEKRILISGIPDLPAALPLQAKKAKSIIYFILFFFIHTAGAVEGFSS